jgi:hypothetical protein
MSLLHSNMTEKELQISMLNDEEKNVIVDYAIETTRELKTAINTISKNETRSPGIQRDLEIMQRILARLETSCSPYVTRLEWDHVMMILDRQGKKINDLETQNAELHASLIQSNKRHLTEMYSHIDALESRINAFESPREDHRIRPHSRQSRSSTDTSTSQNMSQSRYSVNDDDQPSITLDELQIRTDASLDRILNELGQNRVSIADNDQSRPRSVIRQSTETQNSVVGRSTSRSSTPRSSTGTQNSVIRQSRSSSGTSNTVETIQSLMEELAQIDNKIEALTEEASMLESDLQSDNLSTRDRNRMEADLERKRRIIVQTHDGNRRKSIVNKIRRAGGVAQ